MTHEPALEAHEHREHAEHAAHTKDRFILTVSITVAVLAALAAFTGSLETLEAGEGITASGEAVLEQEKAADAWGEYQADSLKRHLLKIAADAGGPRTAEYLAAAKDQAGRQANVRKQAVEDEAERDRQMAISRSHEHRHHWLTLAATLLEIAIAVSTVAIVTHQRAFWLGSITLGVVGAAILGGTYLG